VPYFTGSGTRQVRQVYPVRPICWGCPRYLCLRIHQARVVPGSRFALLARNASRDVGARATRQRRLLFLSYRRETLPTDYYFVSRQAAASCIGVSPPRVLGVRYLWLSTLSGWALYRWPGRTVAWRDLSPGNLRARTSNRHGPYHLAVWASYLHGLR
jgi:hypothetical protein